jgi:hypothetical protein
MPLKHIPSSALHVRVETAWLLLAEARPKNGLVGRGMVHVALDNTGGLVHRDSLSLVVFLFSLASFVFLEKGFVLSESWPTNPAGAEADAPWQDAKAIAKQSTFEPSFRKSSFDTGRRNAL